MEVTSSKATETITTAVATKTTVVIGIRTTVTAQATTITMGTQEATAVRIGTMATGFSETTAGWSHMGGTTPTGTGRTRRGLSNLYVIGIAALPWRVKQHSALRIHQCSVHRKFLFNAQVGIFFTFSWALNAQEVNGMIWLQVTKGHTENFYLQVVLVSAKRLAFPSLTYIFAHKSKSLALQSYTRKEQTINRALWSWNWKSPLDLEPMEGQCCMSVQVWQLPKPTFFVFHFIIRDLEFGKWWLAKWPICSCLRACLRLG